MAACSAPGLITLFGRVLPPCLVAASPGRAAARARDRFAALAGCDMLSAAEAIAVGFDLEAVAQYDVLVRVGGQEARAADRWAARRWARCRQPSRHRGVVPRIAPHAGTRARATILSCLSPTAGEPPGGPVACRPAEQAQAGLPTAGSWYRRSYRGATLDARRRRGGHRGRALWQEGSAGA